MLFASTFENEQRHTSLFCHQTWVLASQHCQPLLMAGLVLPEAHLQDQFVQITPFTHIVKMLPFSLVETCPNSIAYFKDWMSHLVALMGLKNSGAGGVGTASR